MENAPTNYLIPVVLLFIFGTSCVASKEPRIKERIVSLKQDVVHPHVEVHLKNSRILFSKEAVSKILDRGAAQEAVTNISPAADDLIRAGAVLSLVGSNEKLAQLGRLHPVQKT